jgi:hypothetical protein
MHRYLFLLLAWSPMFSLCAHGELTLRPLPDKIYGVTVDAIDNIEQTVDALSSLSKMPMTRIVFDKGQAATQYAAAVAKIAPKSYVMGEIVDSSAMKKYTVAQYKARTREYLKVLGQNVDLWEVGNEINGDWLGPNSEVVAKMEVAYDLVKAKNLRTALTLYYNSKCSPPPDHEMFLWTKTYVPDRMKNGLDYVWVSYYEQDCNNYQPNWPEVMGQLAKMFPNSKVGIGECGASDPSKKADLIRKYYSLNFPLSQFAGGYFWWYFKTDMVPKTQPLWTVLNEELKTQESGSD